jgi:hypothetical protein
MVAEWFQKHGHPFADAVGAGQNGKDIKNMLGLAPEVKATPGDNTGALKQAVKNRGNDLPFVVWRPNGYGPERIAEWPVFFTLEDATRLLTAAGYGSQHDE